MLVNEEYFIFAFSNDIGLKEVRLELDVLKVEETEGDPLRDVLLWGLYNDFRRRGRTCASEVLAASVACSRSSVACVGAGGTCVRRVCDCDAGRDVATVAMAVSPDFQSHPRIASVQRESLFSGYTSLYAQRCGACGQ